jgi:hypothetical protein
MRKLCEGGHLIESVVFGQRDVKLSQSPSVVSEATAEEELGSLMRVCGGRF